MKRNILHFFIVVLSTISLSGCLATGLVAGAGGTYLATKEIQKSRAKQKRAVEKKAVREAKAGWESDRNKINNINNGIAYVLNEKFIGGGLTSVLSIHTVVDGGIVTLYGNVPSVVVLERAIDIARNVRGVKNVISNLVVVEMQITPVGNQFARRNLGPSSPHVPASPISTYVPASPTIPSYMRTSPPPTKYREIAPPPAPSEEWSAPRTKLRKPRHSPQQPSIKPELAPYPSEQDDNDGAYYMLF